MKNVKNRDENLRFFISRNHVILLSSECEYISRASASSDFYHPRIFRARLDLYFFLLIFIKIEININLEFSIMSQK